MHRREETFVHADHPLYAKFARLTQQEEKAGLLADPVTIGTRDGWAMRLSERGFAVRGHRLVRCSRAAEANPRPGSRQKPEAVGDTRGTGLLHSKSPQARGQGS